MESDSPSQVPYVPPGPRRRAEELADRLAVFRRDPRVAVAALVVVALVAGAAWYRMGTGSEPLAAGSPPASSASPSGTAGGSSPTTTGTSKTPDAGARPVVHVAGAVNRTGIVELGPGARVADALVAAGGQRADADLDRLNLAAKVVDGERIFVPRVGEPILPAVGGAAASAGAAAGPVNLNTATATELETLPGVGPAIAAAILDLRQKKGGFSSVNELRDVKGIGESRFADLRDRVTV